MQIMAENAKKQGISLCITRPIVAILRRTMQIILYGKKSRHLPIFFVDENEIWASVPENYVAWHCGAKRYRHTECRNTNSIGVEICMNDKAGNIRMKSIAHAAQFVRKLMIQYGIPVERVIRHYDVTGKYVLHHSSQMQACGKHFENRLRRKKSCVISIMTICQIGQNQPYPSSFKRAF